MSKLRVFGILLILTVVLAACGGSEEPEPTAVPPTTAAVEPAAAEPDAAEPDATDLRTFVVDSAESSASYIVNEEFFADALDKLGINVGKQLIVGTTSNIAGQLQFDASDPAATLGDTRFTVDMTTLETDQNRRDNWIRENGPNFNQFPEATFVATSIEGLPDTIPAGEAIEFQLNGDLSVRDTTIPVTFEVTATLDGDMLTGVATTNLNISDFGIDPPSFVNTLTVADPFSIEVNITARAE
jgi:polyisoprenoid-binding protein YceI